MEPIVLAYFDLNTLSDEERRLTLDGYRIFFEGFTKDDSFRFVEYVNFVHKHLGNPNRLDTYAVIAYVEDVPSAMIWLMGTPLMFENSEVPSVHGGDYAAIGKGKGLPALQVLYEAKNSIAEAGIPFRFGSPSDAALTIASKFGYTCIGWHCSASLDLKSFSESAKPGASADEWFDRFTVSVDSEIGSMPKVGSSKTCEFNPDDYRLMNGRASLITTKKDGGYYAWRVDNLEGKECSYHYARIDGKLSAYLIIEHRGNRIGIVDWDAFGSESQTKISLASLLAHLAPQVEVEAVDINHLNPLVGELDLFQSFGFKECLDDNGNPLQKKFCIMPCADSFDDRFLDFKKWCLCEIDGDEFLNCSPS